MASVYGSPSSCAAHRQRSVGGTVTNGSAQFVHHPLADLAGATFLVDLRLATLPEVTHVVERRGHNLIADFRNRSTAQIHVDDDLGGEHFVPRHDAVHEDLLGGFDRDVGFRAAAFRQAHRHGVGQVATRRPHIFEHGVQFEAAVTACRFGRTNQTFVHPSFER